MLPTLHTPEEVAQALQISVKAVHELCRAGRLSFVRVNGKERRFKAEHVAEYIASQTVERKAPTERYGVIGDSELLHAIDIVEFDHGESQIWVSQAAGTKPRCVQNVRKGSQEKKRSRGIVT